jgi:hypothetical protein
MRLPTVLLSVFLLLVGMAPAAVASQDYERVVDITFPVAGPTTYIDDYHHNRSGGRKHQATDIMAARGQKVHAAVGGTITFITGLDGPPPSYGYMITIRGDDGLSYNYIHLGTQTGSPSEAYAPGMARGTRVQRGEWIGYNGCSGNASCSAPHLHFEIVDPNLNDPHIADPPYRPDRINPYNSLRAAEARGDTPNGEPVPLTGDWNGDGVSTPGWYHDGRVYLRDSNSTGAPTAEFSYGRAGDVPVVGDWNGDGKDTIGIVRGREWHLRFTNSGGPADASFVYGRLTSGDYALAGDWNGDGKDTVGIVRRGEWHLRNALDGGKSDLSFVYGRVRSGDVPVVGDWTNDGYDTPAIIRNGGWYLRLRNAGGPADRVFSYGTSRDTPVVGDWNANGRTTPGVVRGTTWHLRNHNSSGGADSSYAF